MNPDMRFQRLERFWHWAQATLIISLLITGFNVHDSIRLFSFARAAQYHIILAWALTVLWVFAIFWHMVTGVWPMLTGKWRQSIPSRGSQIMAMLHFYAIDIFLAGGHPFHRTRQQKHNLPQRATYLTLNIGIVPVIWTSGWLYLFYDSWGAGGLGQRYLGAIAMVHTAAAFAILVFLVVHLYLAFTVSDTPLGNLKAMITGYEEEENAQPH